MNEDYYTRQMLAQSPQQPGTSTIDPATLEAVLALNQQQAKQAGVNRQYKVADQLRSDAQAQLQGQQAGRRYVAPGAANMIASLAGNIYGAQQADQAGTDQKQLGIDQQKAAALFMAKFGKKPQGLFGGGVPSGSDPGGYYGTFDGS